ncbi:glycoside hydrolase family 99-like domain-containing protein [Nonomuraea sp. KM88]|uniref:glycoside hydrolase family 99-like domain-containing protein n=1 Tax=Nonomuraea sp. KM88 TaxID=3457427 RepID=UPI003FCE7540
MTDLARQADRPKIFAYYFPDYHADARNAAWFGEGWDEWHLVRAAVPRFPEHLQPKVPLLGYQDEADPAVAQSSIELADRFGIDGFIFDYYWYDDGPYLQRALDEGFLGAPNPERVEFSLMWANHDLLDIFPRRDLTTMPRTLKRGAIGRAAFERMARHVVDCYFWRPQYTRVHGRPRFSIYEVGALIRGLGGVREAADALNWFDGLARESGHPGVHFDAVVWGFAVLPAEIPIAAPEKLIRELGFRSASSYVWIHHADSAQHPFPFADTWREVAATAFLEYDGYRKRLGVPFHPNATAGWDASARVAAEAEFSRDDLPYTPVWQATPADFEHGLRLAKSFISASGYDYRELTINAWNEWTEGSYLLPDEVDGFARLEAVLRVFGPRANRGSP